jgi:hypothetical protein
MNLAAHLLLEIHDVAGIVRIPDGKRHAGVVGAELGVNRSKDFLAPLCQKGAKNTLQITNTTFLSGRLPLPTQPAEQQKIAECLSTLDELKRSFGVRAGLASRGVAVGRVMIRRR